MAVWASCEVALEVATAAMLREIDVDGTVRRQRGMVGKKLVDLGLFACNLLASIMVS